MFINSISKTSVAPGGMIPGNPRFPYAYSDEIKKLFPNNKVELNENNEPSKKSGNISLVLSIVLSVVVLAIIIGIIIYCNNKNNKKKEKFSYSYSSYSGSTVEIKN